MPLGHFLAFLLQQDFNFSCFGDRCRVAGENSKEEEQVCPPKTDSVKNTCEATISSCISRDAGESPARPELLRHTRPAPGKGHRNP